jgi:hypothetical protein
MEQKIIFRSDEHAHALLAIDEEAHAAFRKLAEGILAYRQEWDKQELNLFPHLKAAHHKSQIQSATDCEEIAKHSHELSMLSDGTAAAAITDRAKIILRTKKAELKPLAEAVVTAFENALVPMKKAARMAEEEFATAHGFSHFKTPVSARIEKLAVRVAHLRASLNEPDHFHNSAPSRNPYQRIVDFMSEQVRAAKAEANKPSLASRAVGLAVSFAGAVIAAWPK